MKESVRHQPLSLCVYCGSRSGNVQTFVDMARQLGRLMVERNWTLVYGGGNVGLMGELARTVLEGGGTVIGVIPTFLMRDEVALKTCTELIVVPTMHERKAMMLERSDAVLALPGAYGTMDELFEAITWAQLELHDKPVGLLNIEGFYDPLIALLNTMEEDGFLHKDNRGLLHVETDLTKLCDTLMTGVHHRRLRSDRV